MSSRRTWLNCPPLVMLIITLALVAVLMSASPVGAETASYSSSASRGHNQAKASLTTSQKHKSKKHKAKKHKPKKSHASVKPIALSTPQQHPAASSAPTPGKAVQPYTYQTLVHHFTFSGTEVDPSVWGVYNTNGSWSKDRDARRPELVTVSNNTLRVTATGPKGSGLCLCKASVKPTTPYGRYEIRARASANTDHGFAMLLWPNAENWPAGGEIDIAEYNAARSKLWTTVHYSTTNKRYISGTLGDYTQWHTYGVEWTASDITYYVDGVVLMTVTDPAAIPRQAMHLALQAGTNEGVKSPSNTSATLDVAWINEYS